MLIKKTNPRGISFCKLNVDPAVLLPLFSILDTTTGPISERCLIWVPPQG